MATSYIYGLTRDELTLRPGMTFTQDDKGKWSARAELTCHTEDFTGLAIQRKLRKGSPLTGLSSSIDPVWAFMTVDMFTATHEPSGITVVSVDLKGFSDTEFEFDADRSKVYTRNAALQERSILSLPAVADLTWTYVQALRMGMEGKWTEREDSTDTDLKLIAVGNPLLAPVFSSIDANFLEWWNYIIRQGNHTYKVAVSEWTVSTTGKAKLASSDLAKLGKIDATPDGDPATPPDENWMLTGVTENIQVSGEGSNSWSKTWSSSGPDPFPEKIYGTTPP